MSEAAENRYLALKVTMMPRDTNPHGTIFGGVILSYIDQAGFIEARRHGTHRWVTASIQRVDAPAHYFFAGFEITVRGGAQRGRRLGRQRQRNAALVRLGRCGVRHVGPEPGHDLHPHRGPVLRRLVPAELSDAICHSAALRPPAATGGGPGAGCAARRGEATTGRQAPVNRASAESRHGEAPKDQRLVSPSH